MLHGVAPSQTEEKMKKALVSLLFISLALTGCVVESGGGYYGHGYGGGHGGYYGEHSNWSR
jgi:hypothetical protein